MKKKLLALLSAAALFAVAAVPAMADNAHFTFTNIDEPQPDLYVAKSVSSAVDGYSVPEGATFTFVLKWDQDGDGYLEFAENEIYYVYNADGTQVYNEDNSSYIFRTSSTGRFTLQDGQYARFEWAGEVEYEVTEDVSDPYINTSGDKSGTIDASGTYVTFENLYIPEDTGGDTGGGGSGSGAATQVIIRKDISWADGYETPDFSDTEFEFTIKVDGELYTNEAYDIYDAGVTTKTGSGRTGSDGTFTMTGDTAIVFDDVDVGVDYEITETGEADGWRATGETHYAGSTTSPFVYCYFNNEGADFIMTKDRTDGAVGQGFYFILSDDEDDPMADIQYYIYDAKGNLTDSGTTNAYGGFTLCAGEQVIFTGIPDGTEYKITETGDVGYLVTADGSAGEDEVTDTEDYDSIDTHAFVNEQLTDITITKYGNQIHTDLLAGAEFTAYVLNEETGEYEEYAVLTTGEGGTLTFTLPAGTYKIVETKTPAGYIASGDPIEVTLPYTSVNEVDGAVYSERDGLYYLYELNYTVDNTATLIMPNTGGWTWLIILCVIAGACALGIVIRQYYKNHPGNKGVIAS